MSTFPLLPFAAGLATAAFYMVAGVVAILYLGDRHRHEDQVNAIVGHTFLRAMGCWLAWPLVVVAVLIWSAQRRRRAGGTNTTGRL